MKCFNKYERKMRMWENILELNKPETKCTQISTQERHKKAMNSEFSTGSIYPLRTL